MAFILFKVVSDVASLSTVRPLIIGFLSPNDVFLPSKVIVADVALATKA